MSEENYSFIGKTTVEHKNHSAHVHMQPGR